MTASGHCALAIQPLDGRLSAMPPIATDIEPGAAMPKVVRRQVIERGVWPVVVVVALPFFEPIDRVCHRQEP